MSDYTVELCIWFRSGKSYQICYNLPTLIYYNLVNIQLRYGLVDIFTPVIADGLQWQAVMAYISVVPLLLSGKKSGWLPVTIRFV